MTVLNWWRRRPIGWRFFWYGFNRPFGDSTIPPPWAHSPEADELRYKTQDVLRERWQREIDEAS